MASRKQAAKTTAKTTAKPRNRSGHRTQRPEPEPYRRSGPERPPALQGVTVGWAALADIEPQVLGATYWFDSDQISGPAGDAVRAVTVRFSGRRVGVRGKLEPGDSFVQFERIEGMRPGLGRVCLTTRVHGINPGEWQIDAAPANNPGERGLLAGWANRPRLDLPRARATARTAFGRVVRAKAPGAHLAAWPALVLTGFALALLLETLLAQHLRIGVGSALAVSAAASLIGAAGAKIWYLLLHRRHPRTTLDAGMCIQGFVAAAIPAVVVGAALAGIAVGAFLDMITPGLLFAMTIGRFGCFFGGCCAGRPTTSRFGLWSSNRRLGLRRIPVQLIESAMAATLGGAALPVILLGPPQPAGATFIATLAAYTAGRQLLFPLRDEPRRTRYGRQVTLVLATTIAIAAMLTTVFR